jgi:GT2 family glycosyltransferase
VVVKKNWLKEIINPLETRNDIGVVGCKLYYPNSHIIQHAGGILYPNMMCDHFGNGEEDKGQYDEERFVDFVTGAAFATKRSLLEKLNGFDENFFPAYYEETDFCVRIRKTGLKILYNPKAVAYHYESSSLTKLSESFYKTFYKNRILILVKHYSIKDWLTKFLPFEIKWILFEPKAKTTRWKQFKAYLHIPYFLWKKLINKI